MSELLVELTTGGSVPAAALDIRRTVFIEGQDVPESRERDGLDEESDHYVGYVGEEPVATTRV
ncbi:MAG TPA: hypothetical protein VG964_03165, partial [Candidatus Saccharimonadales bacterium]|nr:hypothetical protein [Candidatus Saccharimonadales bacterium]